VPGLIDTLGANDEVRHTTAKTPLGRIGRPDEIAAMIRMLCGPEIRYMTGQTLHMNGGGLMP
jgi:3-oxoacyl-[acyl-carrier protein] reductase